MVALSEWETPPLPPSYVVGFSSIMFSFRPAETVIFPDSPLIAEHCITIHHSLRRISSSSSRGLLLILLFAPHAGPRVSCPIPLESDPSPFFVTYFSVFCRYAQGLFALAIVGEGWFFLMFLVLFKPVLALLAQYMRLAFSGKFAFDIFHRPLATLLIGVLRSPGSPAHLMSLIGSVELGAAFRMTCLSSGGFFFFFLALRSVRSPDVRVATEFPRYTNIPLQKLIPFSSCSFEHARFANFDGDEFLPPEVPHQ